MSEPMSERERWQLELDKLQRGLQGDPFAFLGPQRDPGGEGGVLRAYLPGAQRVELLDEDGATLAELEQSDPGSGLFQRHLSACHRATACACTGRTACRKAKTPMPSGRCSANSTSTCSPKATTANWPPAWARN